MKVEPSVSGMMKVNMYTVLFFLRVYVLFVGQKTQCVQIYIKLTQFEDHDSRKLH